MEKFIWIAICGFVLSVCGWAIYDENTPAGKAASAQLAAEEHKKEQDQFQHMVNQTPGLEDCTAKLVGYVKVVRCPNSSTTTTYQCGKSCTSTTTVSEESK